MISRPLDLVSKLRAPPRNFDGLFYICVAMTGLQFALFGSDYVHTPGVPVDFNLARMANDAAEGERTTHRVTITKQGELLTQEGAPTEAQFVAWLKREAKVTRDPVLLIVPDSALPVAQLWRVEELAQQNGFKLVVGHN